MSHTFPPHVIAEIQERSRLGRYGVRGWGALRRLPTFDDLLLLTGQRRDGPGG